MEPFKTYIINGAIMISRLTAWLITGSGDEMLCSMAWRLQHQPHWDLARLFFDSFYPLSQWKGDYGSHCEACFYAEKWRLEQKVKDFNVSYYYDVTKDESRG